MDATTLEHNIGSAVKTAANIAEVIAPQYAGFIVLGQAVATAIPELYEDVMEMVHKGEPTADEQAALAAKITALANPEAL